jgi:ABC-2 type transport system permease protein
VAWITGGAFCLVLHALFYFAGYPIGRAQYPAFWAGNLASLHVVFAWLPLLLVFLAPALTMGSFAEERRAGTEELLLTWPLARGSAVVAKFLGSLCFLGLLLAIGVLPLALLAAALGPLDWGVTALGFAGALLLGGACLALGGFVSALVSDQLVAFLVSALALGAAWLGGLLAPVAPGGVADLLWFTSPQAHFLDTLARGLFDLRDVLWLGGLTLVFLLLTQLVLEARRSA